MGTVSILLLPIIFSKQSSKSPNDLIRKEFLILVERCNIKKEIRVSQVSKFHAQDLYIMLYIRSYPQSVYVSVCPYV